MSAWLVSNRHVNALATFAVDQGLCADPAAAALGMWCENRASLRDRYEDRAATYWPELATLEGDFAYRDVTLPSLWHVISAADCYDYQSCEHDGWKSSAAKALTDAVRARACEMLGFAAGDDRVRRHPEYESAPWGIENEEVSA